MRWKRGTSGAGIEDRRGMGGGFGGGFGRLPAAGGLGGMGIIGLLLYMFLGGGLGGGGGGGMPALDNAPSSAGDELSEFVKFVVNDVQASWQQEFTAAGQDYPETQLVLFEQATPTGCGTGSSSTGPFYCPADNKVYLDLGFFRELRSRFGAPGDFAQAYVIAHEFGHHVQTVLGLRPSGSNEASVRHELQADCLAGIWAHSAQQRGLLEAGDVQEGLDAAAAVGDDRLQSQAGQRVNPESWTHGSSEQRADAFDTGFSSGSVRDCGV